MVITENFSLTRSENTIFTTKYLTLRYILLSVDFVAAF